MIPGVKAIGLEGAGNRCRIESGLVAVQYGMAGKDRRKEWKSGLLAEDNERQGEARKEGEVCVCWRWFCVCIWLWLSATASASRYSLQCNSHAERQKKAGARRATELFRFGSTILQVCRWLWMGWDGCCWVGVDGTKSIRCECPKAKARHSSLHKMKCRG